MLCLCWCDDSTEYTSSQLEGTLNLSPPTGTYPQNLNNADRWHKHLLLIIRGHNEGKL